MEINPSIFLTLFGKMDTPAFFHDSQFRLLFANLAYYRQAGLSESESLGKPYWEVFPKGKGPLPCCEVSAHNNSNEVSIDEFAFGNKVFLSQGYKVAGDLSEPAIFFHALADITDRVVAEKS